MSAAVASLACIAMLTGCSNSTTSSESAEDTAASALEVAQKAIDGKVLSTGANGEEAASADVADLTDEEVQKIKDAHLKAALVFHYAGNDWYNAQVAGLKATFEELGVEIIATTDADFSPDKQVSDIETVLAQNPDIIISIPTDATATSAAYKKVAEAGVTLVFMDQPANDLEAGKDYVSVVSPTITVTVSLPLTFSPIRSARRARSPPSTMMLTSSSPSSVTKVSRRPSKKSIRIFRSSPRRASPIPISSPNPSSRPTPSSTRTLIWQACGLPGMCPPKVSWPPPVAPDVTI